MRGRPPKPEGGTPDAQRREKSDVEKQARGESKLSTWISVEATAALEYVIGGDKTRGAKQAAVNEALIASAAELKRKREKQAK